MSRTIIDIPAPLLHATDELCARLGVSRAEVVRRALRGYLQQHESVKTDGFGLWAAEAPAPVSAARNVSSLRRGKRPEPA